MLHQQCIYTAATLQGFKSQMFLLVVFNLFSQHLFVIWLGVFSLLYQNLVRTFVNEAIIKVYGYVYIKLHLVLVDWLSSQQCKLLAYAGLDK